MGSYHWELISLDSNRFLGSLDNISRCRSTPTELFETGETDLFRPIHINFPKKNNKISRENPGSMKKRNTFEYKGNQVVRGRDCVHVSTVQEYIFHFRIYLLFEIFTVFVFKVNKYFPQFYMISRPIV